MQIISFQSFSSFFIENLVNFKVFTCIYAVLFTFVHNGASYNTVVCQSLSQRALYVQCTYIVRTVGTMYVQCTYIVRTVPAGVWFGLTKVNAVSHNRCQNVVDSCNIIVCLGFVFPKHKIIDVGV